MKTKKIVSFLMVSVGLILLPLATKAENDPNISSLTFSGTSSVAGATSTQTWTMETSTTLASGTRFEFYIFDANTVEGGGQRVVNAPFDFSGATGPFSETVVGTFNGSDGGGGQILLSDTLSAGMHEFTITNVINTATAGNYVAGITTQLVSGTEPMTFSDQFSINESGDSEDEGNGDGEDDGDLENAIAVLTLDRASSYIAGQRANYTLSMEINRDIDITESINVFIDSGEAGPDKAGFSFTGTTLDSDDFEADIVAEGNGVIAEIHPTTALTAGTYTFTLKNIRNSSTPDTYYVRVTTGAVEPGASMAFTSGFNIIGTPDKPTKLKTKKVKTTSATLSWKGDSVASFYKLQLSNKKGKKIKTFKNLTTTKKVIKSKAKLLKPAKTYKFRARACNEAGCSQWSKYKSFKTKTARQTQSSPITSLTFASDNYKPSGGATHTWTIVVASTISSSDRIEFKLSNSMNNRQILLTLIAHQAVLSILL